MNEERQCARQAEERSADRRACKPNRGFPPGHNRRSVWQLVGRDDGADRPRVGDGVDRRAAPFYKCNDRDHPKDDLVESDQETKAPDRHGPDGMRRDHQTSATPTIRSQPRRQRKHRHPQ